VEACQEETMRGHIGRYLCVLLVALALGGCGAAAGTSSDAQPPSEPVYERGVMPELGAIPTAAPAAADSEEAPTDGSGLPTAEQAAAQDRMIVRNADISLRVEAVQTAIGQLRALAESAGGYVISESTWDDGTNMNAVMTLRVPAERFDSVLDSVSGLSLKVISSSITGQDVTEEYVDIESRLKALRATEEQLLLLLDDVRERMKSAEDILAVYRELQNVQLQIEELEGRRQYLERMVAMSTINLTLYPKEAEVPVVAQGWQPLRTAREALHSLSGAIQGLVNAIIWLALFVLPIVLLIALPFVALVLIVRALTRNRHSRHPVAPAVAPVPPTDAPAPPPPTSPTQSA
jgi:hypothetical protein